MTDETDRRSAVEAYDPPVTELIREALDDTRQLVRIEVALARDELQREVAAAKAGAMASGIAVAVAVAALTMFVVAVVLALKAGWIGALVAGAILLVTALTLGLIGWKLMPTTPMGQTKGRLQANVAQLKERIA
jgi:protein-S-isoprenylcysteine O-methyltransferase Ste14